MEAGAHVPHGRAGRPPRSTGSRRDDRLADHDVDLVGEHQPGPLGHHALGTTDADGHDGHTGAQGHVGRPVEHRLHDGSRLALAFGEEHERLAPGEHGDATAQRLTVRGASAHGESTQRGQQPCRCRVLPQRVLAHEAQPPTRETGGDRRVHVRAMDRRQDVGTRNRKPLAPLDVHPRVRPGDDGHQRSGHGIGEAAHRACSGEGRSAHVEPPSGPMVLPSAANMATIRSTTSAMVTPVVSTRTAPPA